MKKYIKILIKLFFIIIYSCQPPIIMFDYVPFGDKNFETTVSSSDEIVMFKNRLDIDSQYLEMGVLISNIKINDKNIQIIKTEAYHRKADGFLIEGKNIVLIKYIKKLKNDEKNINI